MTQKVRFPKRLGATRLTAYSPRFWRLRLLLFTLSIGTGVSAVIPKRACAYPVGLGHAPAAFSLTPFDIAPAPHLVATLSLFGVLALAEGTVKPALTGGFDCPLDATGTHCDARRLWGPDRGVVGHHAATWRQLSDLGNVLALGGAVAATITDSYLSASATPATDAAIDVLILAESAGVATFVTHVLKYAIRRPRPSMYLPGYLPGSVRVESQLSFPSGHTTASAAGCAAYATAYALRHPRGWGRYGVAAAGVAVTAFTAYGRVAGGMHFYTDVVAGALVGGAVGYLLPTFYRRRMDVHFQAQKDAVGGQALAATLSLAL